jgi:hypothetical protein
MLILSTPRKRYSLSYAKNPHRSGTALTQMVIPELLWQLPLDRGLQRVDRFFVGR